MARGTSSTAPPVGFDLYQAIGGKEACHKLSAALYSHVERDPVLRPLFPSKNHRCAIEAFAAFLAQFLGGPPDDAQHRWWLSLRESHRRFSIGPKERDAWMNKMAKALDDVPIEEPARSALYRFFEKSSADLVNRGQGACPTEKRNDPTGHIHRDLVRRWDAQRALDEAVTAVRSGDAVRAIRLAQSPALQRRFREDRAVLVSLLAVMTGSDPGAAMLDYVQKELASDPALAQVRYSGRTLLHGAAAAGSVTVVELLLGLGADPNAMDSGEHAPLYCVGNECTVASGGEVVRTLVQAGAKVDAHGGVKHCTALHMAARRGNVEVADALLDCGADIEARDSLGETPLRRAVNCSMTELAALLLSLGADLRSKGSKGLTPLLAARSTTMKRLLQSWKVRV